MEGTERRGRGTERRECRERGCNYTSQSSAGYAAPNTSGCTCKLTHTARQAHENMKRVTKTYIFTRRHMKGLYTLAHIDKHTLGFGWD